MNGPAQPVERARIGPFEVNFPLAELRKNGIRLKIHDQPLEILRMLVSRPGELVTREEIRQRLWPSGTFVDFDNGLNSAINRLRSVLGDSAECPKFIETIPRRGYRFTGDVSRHGYGAPAQTATVPTTAASLAFPRESAEPRHKIRFVWLWSAAAGLAAVALATLLAFHHASLSGMPTLSFHARDWALVAQFENRTGETILDGTVDAALARELTNSQFVTVVPRERVNDTLALMRLPANTAISAAIGREVCLRDGGIRAMVAGRVERVSSAYILSAQLVEPASGRAVESFEEDANSQAEILRAVHALSGDVRRALGQKVSEIQQGDLELQKVTTPSLEALQLYSQADQQIRDGNQPAAFELLRDAMNEDANFASAYILAAYALANQGKKPAEFMPYAKKALELSSQTSEAERYFIEGSYYEMTKQPDRAIAAYQALLRVNPGHFWGSNNLNGLLIPENRMQEIVELSVHRADAEPNNFEANWGAGYDLLLISARPDLAHAYVRRASELLPAMTDLERTKIATEGLWVQLYPAYEAWLKDDVALARADLERAEENPVARDGFSDPLMFAEFRQALGETRKAKAWLVKASPPPDEGGTLELAALAFLDGDHTAARIWLERVERNENQPRIISPMAVSLLVREGMVHQANSFAQKYNEWRPQFRNVAMGELLFSQGKTMSAAPLLRDGINEERNHAYPTYFLGAASLARAYERNGNFSAAVEVLESASADRARANGPFKMSGATLWMRNQMHLAQLYRRMDRVKDAETIEAELRTLLAYADPDYPMLVELKRLQNNPSLTANRN